jgi:hypothetical protein
MVKKNWVKNIEKGDVVTRFWYTFKSFDPVTSCKNDKHSCKWQLPVIHSHKLNGCIIQDFF